MTLKIKNCNSVSRMTPFGFHSDSFFINASCCCRMELIDFRKSLCGKLFQALTMSRRSSARYHRLGNLRSLLLALVHPVHVVLRWYLAKASLLLRLWSCDTCTNIRPSCMQSDNFQTVSYCLCNYSPFMIFNYFRGSSYSCFCSVCHMRSNYILILMSCGNYVLRWPIHVGDVSGYMYSHLPV